MFKRSMNKYKIVQGFLSRNAVQSSEMQDVEGRIGNEMRGNSNGAHRHSDCVNKE